MEDRKDNELIMAIEVNSSWGVIPVQKLATALENDRSRDYPKAVGTCAKFRSGRSRLMSRYRDL